MASSREKTARLVIIEGKDNRDKGKVINLKKNYMIIGRGQADIVLNDLQVSRAHVALEFDERKGELTFTDLGSTNGTLLNGELRKSGVLKDRDRLKVGHTVFDCQLEHESQTEIGTSAQLRQGAQLSQSSSVSLPGPSRLSSVSEDSKLPAQPLIEKEPRPGNSKNIPNEARFSKQPLMDNRANFFQKIPRSAKIGSLTLLIVIALVRFLTVSPERSVSNKSVENYVGEINKLLESQQLEEAKTVSLEAIKAFPNHSVPMVLLGNVYFELRKIDLAIDSYRRSLTLKPVQLITYTRLIRLYLIINKKDEAKSLMAVFLPLLDASNPNPKLFVQIGELFLDYPELEPDKDQAINRARRLQTKDAPSDPIGFKMEANLLYMNDKSPDSIKKVEELLKKGLALNPKDEWIYDRMFYLKLNGTTTSEAENTLQIWIKATPKSTKPLLLFSYLKFNEKKYLEAIPYLQKIMTFLAKEPNHPHYAEALNLMGNISMQQNQLAEAENFFRQSCQYGFKASCSHPLISSLPTAPEAARTSQQALESKPREPGSLPQKSKIPTKSRTSTN